MPRSPELSIRPIFMKVVSVDIGDGFPLDALIIAVFSVVMHGRIETLEVILVTVILVALTNGLTMMGLKPFFVKCMKGSLMLVALSINRAMQSEYITNRMYRRKAQARKRIVSPAFYN